VKQLLGGTVRGHRLPPASTTTLDPPVQVGSAGAPPHLSAVLPNGGRSARAETPPRAGLPGTRRPSGQHQRLPHRWATAASFITAGSGVATRRARRPFRHYLVEQLRRQVIRRACCVPAALGGTIAPAGILAGRHAKGLLRKEPDHGRG
jgi:hypothetical protein